MLGPTTWAVEKRGSSTVKPAASLMTSMHRSRRVTSHPPSTGTHDTGSRSRRRANASYGSSSSWSRVIAAPSGNRPSSAITTSGDCRRRAADELEQLPDPADRLRRPIDRVVEREAGESRVEVRPKRIGHLFGRTDVDIRSALLGDELES